MRRTALTWALALALLLALPPRLFAGPEVVASIAPVHSLVARVMQGAGRPHLLLPPGASPHHHALRPSDAAALERAALVFWVGPRLERWLTRSLTTLAAGARVVRLADAPGLTRLALRQGAVFAAHEHASEPDHDEAEIDPHLWLDPDNAKLWLDAIAAALAGADPARRALYLANAEAARAELDALAAEIEVRLAPVRGRPFVVLHDSFQYFERRFGIEFDDMGYLEDVDQLSIPILLFHGDSDERVPVETSDELAGARPDLVTYERVPGAEHVHAWNMDPDRYESAVESFLGTVAGG